MQVAELAKTDGLSDARHIPAVEEAAWQSVRKQHELDYKRHVGFPHTSTYCLRKIQIAISDSSLRTVLFRTEQKDNTSRCLHEKTCTIF